MAIIHMPEFEHLWFHSQFPKELDKIKKGFSHRKEFDLWLRDCFLQLDDSELNFRDFPKKFEPIKNFYAITFRHTEKNIRILFCIHNRDIKILLCGFDEKKTRADYDTYIKIATQRMKQFKQEES